LIRKWGKINFKKSKKTREKLYPQKMSKIFYCFLVGIAVVWVDRSESVYTNAYELSSGCSGDLKAATTYPVRSGNSSGCHYDMIWEWSNNKPSCSTYAIKISDHLDDTSGCGVTFPDLHFIMETPLDYNQCTTFLRDMTDEKSMRVRTFLNDDNEDELVINIYSDSACQTLEHHFSRIAFLVGETCITEAATGNGHLYVKWC
jgi:hypothetical protein